MSLKNVNVQGGRFVLAIKDKGNNREVSKAQCFAQGYRHRLNTSLVHGIPTTRKHFQKILIGSAAIFGFRIFSGDVQQS